MTIFFLTAFLLSFLPADLLGQTQAPADINTLPDELKVAIIDACIPTNSDKPKEMVDALKSLACTSTEWNSLVNREQSFYLKKIQRENAPTQKDYDVPSEYDIATKFLENVTQSEGVIKPSCFNFKTGKLAGPVQNPTFSDMLNHLNDRLPNRSKEHDQNFVTRCFVNRKAKELISDETHTRIQEDIRQHFNQNVIEDLRNRMSQIPTDGDVSLRAELSSKLGSLVVKYGFERLAYHYLDTLADALPFDILFAYAHKRSPRNRYNFQETINRFYNNYNPYTDYIRLEEKQNAFRQSIASHVYMESLLTSICVDIPTFVNTYLQEIIGLPNIFPEPENDEEQSLLNPAMLWAGSEDMLAYLIMCYQSNCTYLLYESYYRCLINRENPPVFWNFISNYVLYFDRLFLDILESYPERPLIESSMSNNIIHLFCMNKNTKLLEGEQTIDFLLNRYKIDINTANEQGLTPFMLAILSGKSINFLEKLEGLGANIMKATPAGVTPLILAVQSQNPDAVKFLLTHGANKDESTPRGLAAKRIARRKHSLYPSQETLEVLNLLSGNA